MLAFSPVDVIKTICLKYCTNHDPHNPIKENILKFKELLKVKREKNTTKIDLKNLLDLFPNTHLQVIQQFYSDHGMNKEFQNQYKNIELNKIRWELNTVEASELLNISIYKNFYKYVKNVSNRCNDFTKKGWDCLFIPKNCIDEWKNNNSWIIPPIFITGNIIKSDKNYIL